ncbi:hypothetical protein FS749_010169 [Ceratobasidium sp. UAMH 11750]|nr:hypothetical protein FS749_010169 [Ceratobasidium sp. UAMH 11750]
MAQARGNDTWGRFRRPPLSVARPPYHPYSFAALLDAPRCVFHPPPAQVKVCRVRSMSLTPLFEAKLCDVLGG